MNYSWHYDALMRRAVSRELVGYSEKHHIIPRCLGGTNSKDNIVRLTPEEHYVAHQLLVKMHPGNHRLVWAAMNMTGKNAKQQRSNKIYGWLRRKFADTLRERSTGRKASPEARAKMSAARRGKKRAPHSPETKAKMSAAMKGKPKSAAHRAKMSELMRGTQRALGHKKSPETIALISAKKRGHVCHSNPEYRQKQSENMLRIWAERKQLKEGTK